jgi:hypothetical protein
MQEPPKLVVGSFICIVIFKILAILSIIKTTEETTLKYILYSVLTIFLDILSIIIFIFSIKKYYFTYTPIIDTPKGDEPSIKPSSCNV